MVNDVTRAKIQSFLNTQWSISESFALVRKIDKSGMGVAELMKNGNISMIELHKVVLETKCLDNPDFALCALGAMALFDNFRWSLLYEGKFLHLRPT